MAEKSPPHLHFADPETPTSTTTALDFATAVDQNEIVRRDHLTFGGQTFWLMSLRMLQEEFDAFREQQKQDIAGLNAALQGAVIQEENTLERLKAVLKQQQLPQTNEDKKGKKVTLIPDIATRLEAALKRNATMLEEIVSLKKELCESHSEIARITAERQGIETELQRVREECHESNCQLLDLEVHVQQLQSRLEVSEFHSEDMIMMPVNVDLPNKENQDFLQNNDTSMAMTEKIYCSKPEMTIVIEHVHSLALDTDMSD